jgi:hypothetical protein
MIVFSLHPVFSFSCEVAGGKVLVSYLQPEQ